MLGVFRVERQMSLGGKDAEKMCQKSIQCGKNNYSPIKNKFFLKDAEYFK